MTTTFRTFFFLLVAMILPPHLAGAQDQSGGAEHVILISIDGLRPEFYLDSSWPAPTLQEMARSGVSATGVKGVFPSVTYPSHTTIVTGAFPAKHGIHYNSPFEPEGQTGRWYWEEDAITVPTLWDAVEAAEKTSAAVSWPVTVGAPIDWNIPEVWPIGPGPDRVETIRLASRPAGLFGEIEEMATGQISVDRLDTDYIELDALLSTMGAYIFRTYRPNLLAVHIIAADHFQHENGRDHVMVRRALAHADAAVWRLVEAAKQAGLLGKTAFIVTGDHGFIDIHTRLAPNVWLAEAGLLEVDSDRGDWRAAFHTSGAAAFLHLRDPSDRKATEKVREILAAQPDPVRRLFRVLEPDELSARDSAPGAVLALDPIPGVDIISATDGAALRPTSGATHGYSPDLAEMNTGFIGWGPGFAKKVTVVEMGLEHIAPVVARLLDLEFEAPDGVLLPGMVDF